MSIAKRKPPHLERLKPLGLVVALVAAASLVCNWLDGQVSLTSLAMVYLLVVVVAAYRLDWLHSAMCAVASVVAFNYLFVPPRRSFSVEGPQEWITLFAILLVALLISRLSSRLRREIDIVRLNEARARQLQALATALPEVRKPEHVLALGKQALDTAFAGPSVIALRHADGALDVPAGLSSSVFDGLQACMHEAAVLGPGTGRWPGLNAWYLPLGDREHLVGAVYLGLVDAQDEGGREHAQALCALLAQTLWRQQLAARKPA